MSSYEINSSSLPVTISSPGGELPSQQTNPFLRAGGNSFSPSTLRSSSKSLGDVAGEYGFGTPQPSISKLYTSMDNWWEAVEDAGDDNVSLDNLVVGISTAASTDSIMWERHLNNVSELTFDGSDPEGGLQSDNSGPEYSGDGSDMNSNSSFSDDEDDDLFNATSPPSFSYADLFEMCLNGPRSPKKRYLSGWWEDIGSKRSLFPISYTNFEDSDRLPSILEEDEEESKDDIAVPTAASTTLSSEQLDVSDSEEVTQYLKYSGSEYSGNGDDMSCFSDDDDDGFSYEILSPSISYIDLPSVFPDVPEPDSKKGYRSGWWEEVGSTSSLLPISYMDFENSDRLPTLLEESGDIDTSIITFTPPSSEKLDDVVLEDSLLTLLEESSDDITTSITTFTTPSSEEADSVSKLAVGNFDPEGVVRSLDYHSGSEYSGDGDDMSCFSDDEDDGFSYAVPSPSASYIDLPSIFPDVPEPDPKKKISLWLVGRVLEEDEEESSNDITISATTSTTRLSGWLADSLSENRLPTILEEDEEESSNDITTSITTTTTHTPSLQQLVDSVSELVDNFESGVGVRSDHSGSDYSGDSDDMSDASFSDDDDGLFHVPPSPSSYADLSNIYLDGPEPSFQKKYRSGWWENIGSKRSLFPVSYTRFEDSDRLPPLLEESGDGEALCEPSHSREETSDTS
ncbi:hypothetical protein P167DRAFT_569278 [Morchella conica CCBAS932]|uniref:Uncharacterized protein n=1 Tax=Morchella conica CCBAS932 TaxID=1392247 RepID=A0A3N4L3Y0_9PEZI|nr:hypothetical protein P167DRAFT_569278 [Morchella conica CCBAS932]